VKTNGANRARAVLEGETHSGCFIELHETDLPPGGAPHPPHHHVYEEMLVIREGTLEVTIEGHSAQLGPGSVAYVASNEEHGWRNVGTTRARYMVLASAATLDPYEIGSHAARFSGAQCLGLPRSHRQASALRQLGVMLAGAVLAPL